MTTCPRCGDTAPELRPYRETTTDGAVLVEDQRCAGCCVFPKSWPTIGRAPRRRSEYDTNTTLDGYPKPGV